ncbi:anthranilate synthase component 1 [Blochmannia endosymbiont of Polyrhachis (Hedomyrma) turneri]|uniref:anthranilate synthase component 1 n=1 Tax=Blochmannia endosymbiont of Polyrhachis (Hedomyrma) turneri TaxID=1505596 RepID=UPI00061A6512|nr:anthranilate synthase component 1 [Blochmannia endosymbiont of Polyrhachis (Hedomyrma) turneri]AKC59987.1 anthranilate synthase component I [Blochmannia endosymbiont of Polyrhachis (Hedomyrma) turneri]
MKPKQHQIEIINIQAKYHNDPSAIFNHLCGQRTSTLLLESATINKKHNIESMMIIDSALRIAAHKQNTVTIQALSENGLSLLPLLDEILPTNITNNILSNSRELTFPIIKISEHDEDMKLQSTSIFDCLRWLLQLTKQPQNITNKAIFFGGLFSYDLVTCFESVPSLKNGPKCPYFCFYLAEILLILDHQHNTCNFQASLFNNNNHQEKKRLQNKLYTLQKYMNKTPKPIHSQIIKNLNPTCNKNDEEYKKIIKKMQSAIQKGEIYQVVPSRKFLLPCPSPLAAYHILKTENPSPYMFFMQDHKFTLFGASPESSLKYDSNTRKIEIYPIAGTRPRARNIDGTLNIDLDNRIELEMRSDHKELSEHLMLVDLARNDLARVCIPGTRYVSDLLKVDRYHFVMHLVSRVIGKLRHDLDIFHAYRACMNMGTLSGAPKIRAMQLISEVEKQRRGSYGGSIGYFTGAGNFDTCIIIRSAYIENGIATVQAGAGIVVDSIPQNEADESRNKAQAVLQAIKNAHSTSFKRNFHG